MCKLPYAHIENRVPNGYWKIITLINDKDVFKASFKFDQHVARNADFCKHLTTVKDIEKLSKLQFQDSKYIENSDELLKIMNCKNKQVSLNSFKN
jgi:DNA/RNA endonuclease G (NUC1)